MPGIAFYMCVEFKIYGVGLDPSYKCPAPGDCSKIDGVQAVDKT